MVLTAGLTEAQLMCYLYLSLSRPHIHQNRNVLIYWENERRQWRSVQSSCVTHVARTRPRRNWSSFTVAQMLSGSLTIPTSRLWRHTKMLVPLVHKVSCNMWHQQSFIYISVYIFHLGMVQICAGCSEKHANLAEGGTPPAATATITSAPISESGGTHSLESSAAIYGTRGATIVGNNHMTTTAFVGHNSPSEKSLANSDSTSNVRFKVRNYVHLLHLFLVHLLQVQLEPVWSHISWMCFHLKLKFFSHCISDLSITICSFQHAKFYSYSWGTLIYVCVCLSEVDLWKFTSCRLQLIHW